jgi:KilA-N domain
MSNSIIKSWNKKSIRFREDGYGCLTDMAQAAGKLVADYMRLTSTQELLMALSSAMGIPITDNHAGSGALVEVLQDGIGKEQGTWAHPEVCTEFAGWCNVAFKIQINRWIVELLTTGTVSISKPKRLSSKDLTLEQLMVQGGFWFVPTDEHLELESGREHLHLTPEKYAEIKASIDPIFDGLQQDAIVNLIAILLHPIKVAAFDKEINEAEDLYIQKLEKPDKHFLFYLKEVFGDRKLTNAQILEELLDDRAGELEEEIENLHYQAFEDERLIGATAKFEQRIDRLELAASSKKGLGFGKKSIGGDK